MFQEDQAWSLSKEGTKRNNIYDTFKHTSLWHLFVWHLASISIKYFIPALIWSSPLSLKPWTLGGKKKEKWTFGAPFLRAAFLLCRKVQMGCWCRPHRRTSSRGIVESYLDWIYIKFPHPLRSGTFLQLVRFCVLSFFFLRSVIRLQSGLSVQYPHKQTQVDHSHMRNVRVRESSLIPDM